MLLLTSLFESGGGHEVYQVTNGPPDCYMNNTIYANIHDKILHKENWGGKDSLYGVKLNFFECRSEF